KDHPAGDYPAEPRGKAGGRGHRGERPRPRQALHRGGAPELQRDWQGGRPLQEGGRAAGRPGSPGADGLLMGSVALFVPHVGCPQQCSFCDQRAITGGAQPPTHWQVWQTVQAAPSHLGQRVKETEIAFFGGSFTAIPQVQMLSLLAPAKEAVERFGFRGLRCSTRPDAIDGEVLSLLKAYHMVAVELGAQSMDGEVL